MSNPKWKCTVMDKDGNIVGTRTATKPYTVSVCAVGQESGKLNPISYHLTKGNAEKAMHKFISDRPYAKDWEFQILPVVAVEIVKRMKKEDIENGK